MEQAVDFQAVRALVEHLVYVSLFAGVIGGVLGLSLLRIFNWLIELHSDYVERRDWNKRIPVGVLNALNRRRLKAGAKALDIGITWGELWTRSEKTNWVAQDQS
jgi:hypothetical protein